MQRDFETLEDHPILASMVDIISKKTRNESKNFFRVESAYFLAKIASAMRAQIKTKDRGLIPVNIYAMGLATSGFGKGYSVNIIEDLFMKGFQSRFIETTLQQLSEANLVRLANDRAAYRGTDQSTELTALEKEYQAAGPYPFTFDSGTVPAVKQLRQKLLLAAAGGINLQIDEIGSNLLNNTEIMNTFLELYDKGRTKAKLTKNTVDNSRGIDIDGPTPANVLLFGTPSKLLDGSSIEDTFFEFLQIGYARRMLFAWGEHERAAVKRSASEIYNNLIDTSMEAEVQRLARGFGKLAHPSLHNYEMEVPDDVAIELIEYQILCEAQADKLPEHRELEKTELTHRYFKALKLAGVYAFIDQSPVVTMDNIYQAIHLVEASGRDFRTLLSREPAYVKLARYIAAHDVELTHADLTENLPFYKQGVAARNEMMQLAAAWGYKNNVIIKKSFGEGIEFFSGETLAETDRDAITFSVSTEFAQGYEPMRQPFDKLYKLTSLDGYHWCNHYFQGQHRRAENTIEGFNMVVLDVDGTASLNMVHEMLRDYVFMTYTTKRHQTEGRDRFRVLMPIKYELRLNGEDYKQFMNNIIDWLPFEIDEGANQRERKWLTCGNSQHHYNLQGELLDPIRFIPKTSRNEEYHKKMTELKDFNSLERWFAERMAMGQRNNQMIKFALALLDSGMPYAEIDQRVIDFNKRLSDPLSEHELRTTVLRTVGRKAAGQE